MIHCRINRFCGLKCPLSGEPLDMITLSLFSTTSGNKWRYSRFDDIFRLNNYYFRWDDNKNVWLRMIPQKFWNKGYLQTKYVSYPSTNWKAFVIFMKTIFADNMFIRLFYKWSGRIIEKTGLRKVKKMGTGTLASMIAPITPIAYYTPRHWHIEYVFDSETKGKDDVIIMESTKEHLK